MIKTKYYNNNGWTIYECDRCHKEIDKFETYRINIRYLKKDKNIKTLHLCKRCVQISLAIVNKKLGGGIDEGPKQN